MTEEQLVPPGRRFQFDVVEIEIGLFEVQDTENNRKGCWRTRDKELAINQARHLQPRINGTRLK